jgi:hypothetical protein
MPCVYQRRTAARRSRRTSGRPRRLSTTSCSASRKTAGRPARRRNSASHSTRPPFTSRSGRSIENLRRSSRTSGAETTTLQPFVAAGAYSAFKEIADPRSETYEGRYAPFAYATDTYGNPDFSLKSFRTTNVLRWEYKPGSALFVVCSRHARTTRCAGGSTSAATPARSSACRPTTYFWSSSPTGSTTRLGARDSGLGARDSGLGTRLREPRAPSRGPCIL